jgi:hypothetical protein
MFGRFKKPAPSEISIIGAWMKNGGSIEANSVCNRIEYLVSGYLVKVGISKEYGNWMSLYQDPNDLRLWEHTYPQGEMHGGGPPALFYICLESAKEKFDINEYFVENL